MEALFQGRMMSTQARKGGRRAGLCSTHPLPTLMNAFPEPPIPSPSQPASAGEFIPDDQLLRGRYIEDDEIPNQRPSHGNWLRSKIASLPYGIRTELNERLLDGEQSVPLAQWLNGLPEVQAILRGLKTYGMFLAGTGSGFRVQGALSPQWNDTDLATLQQVPVSALEVVQLGTVITTH